VDHQNRLCAPPSPTSACGVIGVVSQAASGQLGGAINKARRRGWAELEGTLDGAVAAAASLGAEVVPTRPGDPPIGLLRPVPQESAHPASLSATYGLGALPFHTDGAYLRRPPDVVIMERESAADTELVATLLFRVCPSTVGEDVWEAMQQGVFHVRAGRDKFLCVARSGNILRFDPGCMRPLDPASRLVRRFFEQSLDAVRYTWGSVGTVVVLDNTQVLHAREPAPRNSQRRLRRIMLRLPH